MPGCRWLGLAIACALVVAMSACADPARLPSVESAPGQSEPLWVPAGARVTSPATGYGRTPSFVVFTMTTTDIEGLATAIAVHMADDDGWHEHVEPGAWRGVPRTAHVWHRSGGVIQRDEKGTIVDADVREWRGQWVNERGDVMQYQLIAHRERPTGPYEVIGQGQHVPGQ